VGVSEIRSDTSASRATIVGSGLIARAFAPHADALPNVCVYAAGVSNSSCTDPREFDRERERLQTAMATLSETTLLLYFSTCSILDPALQDSRYVLHKRAMEHVVAQRPRHLVFRLPQLAGRTPNPHTLLNYLHARIVRSERFSIFSKAERNIIDVDDVARIAIALVKEGACAETINIACSHNNPVGDIVRCMEDVLSHRGVFDIIEAGAGYAIDTGRIRDTVSRCGISFSSGYLHRTLDKYYGSHGPSAT